MTTTGRPNIVVVLTDQLRYDCVGFNGSRVVRTPRMDAFAAEGMAFHRCYTPTGLCSPARTSMLTGKYPHNHGVMNNVTGRTAIAQDVDPDEALLPRLLADAGYRTAFVGKYHVAAHEAPKRHGFTDAVATGYYWATDDFAAWRRDKGHPLTAESPAFPVTHHTRYRPLTPEGAKRFRQRGAPLMGKEHVPIEATPPAYLVDRGLGLVDELVAGSDPFFLILSFVGPHWPHMVPEPWWSMYDPASLEPWPSFADTYEGKPGTLPKMLQHSGIEGWTWDDWAPIVASYFGSVTFHDELIGRFLAGLAERGADDALTVVTTDHGDLSGSHRQFNKGPLMYEDVYRIPFAARWPDHIAPGRATDAFVSNMDLMPTLLAAAGVDVPPDLDAIDLGPLFAGADGPRDSFFAQYHGDEHGLYSQRMLHTGRWKLVVNSFDVDELYDLETDPWELANLAADPAHADRKRSLEARLFAWMQDTRDPLAHVAGNYLA